MRAVSGACGLGVYAIGCLTYLKIGKSQHVPSRLRSLQTGNPIPLVLHGYWPTADTDAAAALESRIHCLLADYHHQGEWFACGIEDALFVHSDGFVVENAAPQSEPSAAENRWVIYLDRGEWNGRRSYRLRAAASRAEVNISADEAFFLSGFATRRDFNARAHLYCKAADEAAAERVFVERRRCLINRGLRRRGIAELETITLQEAQVGA